MKTLLLLILTILVVVLVAVVASDEQEQQAACENPEAATTTKNKNDTLNLDDLKTRVTNRLYVAPPEDDNDKFTERYDWIYIQEQGWYGHTRQWAQGPNRTAILQVIAETETYMKETVYDSDKNDFTFREKYECRNYQRRCSYLAAIGECVEEEVNENGEPYYDEWMIRECAPACQVCHLLVQDLRDGYERRPEGETDDDDENALDVDFFIEDDYYGPQAQGENVHYQLLANAWGVDQQVGPELIDETIHILDEMETYMKDEVLAYPEVHYLQEICQNYHKDCAYWAAKGACDDEEAPSDVRYMMRHCAPACQACYHMPYDLRCPQHLKKNPAMSKPGDLHTFFLNLLQHPVWSQNLTVVANADQDWNMPWIVTLDDFATQEECERLIELGRQAGYERSSEVGEQHEDGTHDDSVNERRTSTNAWCHSKCKRDPMAQSVIERIEQMSGIHRNYSEDLQLLQYKPGQKYMEHHDFIVQEKDHLSGPRILTAYLYLNDVEEGGATRFDLLDLTVQPKRGRLLLWPSVLDDFPFEQDIRTNHEALPVIRGVKYGANAWLHSYDVKYAESLEC